MIFLTVKFQVKELEKQVSVLNIEALKKEMSLNEQSKNDYLELNAKIQQLKADHAKNLKEIEEEHKDALKRLEESLTRDFKVSTCSRTISSFFLVFLYVDNPLPRTSRDVIFEDG